MYESERHDLLWNMWVSNPFKEGSFDDFKKQQLESTNRESKVEKEAKALEGMNSALAMLGGDFIGN